MASRYWVAFSSTNWNDSFNWASTSGGLGGASVPSTSDDVFFDGNGTGSCSLDVNASVISITIDAGYTGTLDAVTFDLTTSGNFTDNAGRILFGSGTWNIGGNLTLRGTSNTDCQSATINVTGNTPFNQGAYGWIPGTSVWTVGGSVDAFNGRPASSGTYPNWSFTQTGTAKTAQFRDFANYTIASGASITNARAIDGINVTINGTHDLNGKTATANYLVVSSTGTVKSTASGGHLRLNVITNSLADVIVSIQGTLILNSWKISGGGRNQKYITRLQTTSGLELPNFEFGATSTAGGDNWRLQIENDVVFAQDFLFFSDGSGTPGSINNSTYNPNITFKGDVTFRVPNGMNYNVGTGTITLHGSSAQSVDFSGQTVEAIVVSDNSTNAITLSSNFTTPYVHDCANQIDENGYTVTTTGTDPSPCSTGSRYWVGLVDSDYENAGNWSTSSGGLGNASVPVGSNDVVFDSGSSVNCTMAASRSMNSLNFASYAGTFSAGSHSVIVTNSATASGSTAILDLGSSSWRVGGTWNLRFISASSTAGTSSIRLTSQTGSDNWLWFPSGGPFSNITLAQNAIINQGRRVDVNGSFTLESGATWNATDYRLNISNNASLTLGANSSITTTATGLVELRTDNSGVRTGNATASIGNFQTANANTGSVTTIPIATYTGSFIFGQNAASYSGTWRFEGNTVIEGDVSTAMGKSTNETIDLSTNNVSLTLKGDVDITPSLGTITWSAGGGTIIFDNSGSQSVNFNGQTVEGIHVTDASTGSIVLASDFSTAWLRDCDSLIDLNGYTITNADSVDRCVYPYDPPTTIALDSAAAINTDLELWLPLTDGVGTTAVDISTTADNFTATGTPTWVNSKLGNAVELVSNTTYLTSSVYGNTYQVNTPITISAWVKFNTSSDDNGMLQYADAHTNGTPLYALQSYYGYLRWYAKGTHSSNMSAAVGEWHHVALTNNGTSIDCYLNGAYENTLSGSSTAGEDANNKFWIGAGYRYNNTNQFHNFRVWSRALSSSEVSSLYSDPWIGSDYTAVVPPSNRFFSPAAFARLG